MKTERELRPAALAAVKAVVDGQAASWGHVAAMMQYVDAASDRIMVLETNESLMAYMAKQGEKEKKVERENVAGKVVNLLKKLTLEPEDRIVPEARLEEDLKLDSMDKLEMLAALEEVIDGDISDEEAGKLKTVGDVQAFMIKAVG